MRFTRRAMLQGLAATTPAAMSPRLRAMMRYGQGAGSAMRPAGRVATSAERRLAQGAFEPTWESLKTYKTPPWFRDAKFGIWAHWSAQCVPEQGDWYARNMYIQGSKQYNYHVEHYGHPSKFGFKDIDHIWAAENWQPEYLMDLYVKAGAKYFMAWRIIMTTSIATTRRITSGIRRRSGRRRTWWGSGRRRRGSMG